MIPHISRTAFSKSSLASPYVLPLRKGGGPRAAWRRVLPIAGLCAVATKFADTSNPPPPAAAPPLLREDTGLLLLQTNAMSSAASQWRTLRFKVCKPFRTAPAAHRYPSEGIAFLEGSRALGCTPIALLAATIQIPGIVSQRRVSCFEGSRALGERVYS